MFCWVWNVLVVQNGKLNIFCQHETMGRRPGLPINEKKTGFLVVLDVGANVTDVSWRFCVDWLVVYHLQGSLMTIGTKVNRSHSWIRLRRRQRKVGSWWRHHDVIVSLWLESFQAVSAKLYAPYWAIKLIITICGLQVYGGPYLTLTSLITHVIASRVAKL